MLERIMNLQILLCIMAAAGAFGAVGMLAVHLTYRRTLRRTNTVTSLKEKWLNLWKTRDKLLNKMNFLGTIASVNIVPGAGDPVCDKAQVDERAAASVSLSGNCDPGRTDDPETSSGLCLPGGTGNEFSCRLYPFCTDKERGDSHTAKGRTGRTAAQNGPRSPGRDGGEDHGKHPPDSGNRKSFQQMLSPEEEEIMREIIREFME